MLIVIGGEKGGTGKTMIATNLAVCYAIAGVDVLLVDADPQRSASKWAQARAKRRTAKPSSSQVHCVELRGDDIADQLLDLDERYDRVIVDVAGSDSAELRAALAVADRLYSPMVPSDCDLETAGELHVLVRHAKLAANVGLRAHIVLNLCPTHVASTDIEDSRHMLAELKKHLPVCETTLATRRSYRDAYRHRSGVCEDVLEAFVRSGSTDKAAHEFQRLFDEIEGESP